MKVSLKKLFSWTALVGLSFCALSAPVYAQQTAGQAIPETQNPQSITGQPIQQQGKVQTTEAADLLNQSRTIVIPAGNPAQPANSYARSDNSTYAVILIAMGLVGLGLMGVWAKSGHQPEIIETEETAPLKTPRPDSKRTKKKPRAKQRNR